MNNQQVLAKTNHCVGSNGQFRHGPEFDPRLKSFDN